MGKNWVCWCGRTNLPVRERCFGCGSDRPDVFERKAHTTWGRSPETFKTVLAAYRERMARAVAIPNAKANVLAFLAAPGTEAGYLLAPTSDWAARVLEGLSRRFGTPAEGPTIRGPRGRYLVVVEAHERVSPLPAAPVWFFVPSPRWGLRFVRSSSLDDAITSLVKAENEEASVVIRLPKTPEWFQ